MNGSYTSIKFAAPLGVWKKGQVAQWSLCSTTVLNQEKSNSSQLLEVEIYFESYNKQMGSKVWGNNVSCCMSFVVTIFKLSQQLTAYMIHLCLWVCVRAHEHRVCMFFRGDEWINKWFSLINRTAFLAFGEKWPQLNTEHEVVNKSKQIFCYPLLSIHSSLK